MLPRAVACRKTAKGEHCPEVAVCKKIVDMRRLGKTAKGQKMPHGAVYEGTVTSGCDPNGRR